MTDDLADDPRFQAAIAAFNAEEFEEAGDAFEELFFEAVRDEVELVRTLLQVSVGLLHAERGQRKAAEERLGEGLLTMERVTNARGLDLETLRADVVALLPRLRPPWPKISGAFRNPSSPASPVPAG